MSDTSGSRPADARPNPPADGEPAESTQDSWSTEEQAQPSPQQPYDVPTSAQQYGQPPATGYQPPETDPPGGWAPVQGQGPQQYGQPEHGQASYAQEGFPAPGVPGGYQPVDPGYGQPAPGFQPPAQGYQPQAPGYEQPGYEQPGYAQPGYAQPGYPGQPPYVPPAQPYPGQGYPPPAYAAPQPLSDGDQRLWTTLTHLSIPFFGFVGPLVAYLVLKDRSPFLKDSTTEALNFSIVFSIALTVSSFLTAAIIGVVLLPIVWIVGIVLCILAAIRANKGEVYRYPLSWRLVK